MKQRSLLGSPFGGAHWKGLAFQDTDVRDSRRSQAAAGQTKTLSSAP